MREKITLCVLCGQVSPPFKKKLTYTLSKEEHKVNLSVHLYPYAAMKTLPLALNKNRELRLALTALGTVGFALATALGAHIKIPLPFTPVPLTAQTYFVLLSGVCLGTCFGPLSQLLYLLLGFTGLPYFAGGKGVAVLWGATGGYLVGFIAASLVAGFFFRSQRPLHRLSLLAAATLLIYCLGVLNLALLMHTNLATALAKGMLPFLPGDLLKLALVYVTARGIEKAYGGNGT